ncbi:hypothetical protein GCM10027188_12390 [Lysobacter humi (ex Lee et al. 2017)]
MPRKASSVGAATVPASMPSATVIARAQARRRAWGTGRGADFGTRRLGMADGSMGQALRACMETHGRGGG